MIYDRIRRSIENLLFALFYARFATIHAHAVAIGQWHVMPFVLQETLLACFFLTRRDARETSRDPGDWLVGIAGTFLPLLIHPGTTSIAAGIPLQMVGLSISILALCTLRRSFGIVAADRGVKTSGLYAIVRHPMYLGHAVTLGGYFCTYPSDATALLVGATLAAMAARILAEETLLEKTPDYIRYAARVRWRLIPGVF